MTAVKRSLIWFCKLCLIYMEGTNLKEAFLDYSRSEQFSSDWTGKNFFQHLFLSNPHNLFFSFFEKLMKMLHTSSVYLEKNIPVCIDPKEHFSQSKRCAWMCFWAEAMITRFRGVWKQIKKAKPDLPAPLIQCVLQKLWKLSNLMIFKDLILLFRCEMIHPIRVSSI